MDEASRGVNVRASEPAGGFAALGARLHGLRRMRALALKDVAAEVGVSASFLSMVERGESDISIGRLTRLANFYGINPSDLLLDDTHEDEPVISRVTESKFINRGPGIQYWVVREEHPQVMYVELAPHAHPTSMVLHRGEDFWIVLEGTPSLLYGSRQHTLDVGQTVRFAGSVPHSLANSSDEPARIVAVSSIPYW